MSETNVRRRGREKDDDRNLNKENLKEHLQDSSSNSSFITTALLTVVIFTLVCVNGYYNSPINAVEIEGLVKVNLEGVFAVNQKLSKGKKILLPSPESIAEGGDGKLYTGLTDGRVVCIHPSNDGEIGAGKVENITTGVIEGAVNTSDAWGHGRPLGIRLRNQSLYVMDAIYGFYVIDLPTKSLKILIEPDDVTPPMKFPDDFDITADGTTVYMTDVSPKFAMTQLSYIGYEGSCTSRLIKYDMLTQKLDVVKDGLCFGNGVQLIDDESMVIVVETTHYRVNWIDTKTWQIKHVLHLPVMPDNIRKNARGTYWIAGKTQLTWIFEFAAKYPVFRQTAAGLFSHDVLMTIAENKHGMLFEVNSAGKVIQTLHDPEGQLTHGLSQGTELSDGRIALGTFNGNFLSFSNTEWSL
uniref:adipocyte plasma membrane-associated protein-like n=1 Tax=Ciona intestinalis TaxID=7719 RepID=UPI00006A5E28|nr:adipocyte plasma membrane-associated protein-like [Ciona intestinalis]|eukprot:XP_002126470.1 adipocyte plasma membrane-associated protein-like [Ciona intestinalis]